MTLLSVPVAAGGGSAELIIYRIEQGDTLRKIAQRYDTTIWAIVSANPEKIANPDLIYAGDTLVIPPPRAANLPEGFWAPLGHPNWDAGKPLSILYAVGTLGVAPDKHEEREWYYFFYPAHLLVERPEGVACKVSPLFECPETPQGELDEADWWYASRCRAVIPAGVAGAYPLVPGKYQLTCGGTAKIVTLRRGDNVVSWN